MSINVNDEFKYTQHLKADNEFFLSDNQHWCEEVKNDIVTYMTKLRLNLDAMLFFDIEKNMWTSSFCNKGEIVNVDGEFFNATDAYVRLLETIIENRI